jgi:hypothetical protein
MGAEPRTSPARAAQTAPPLQQQAHLWCFQSGRASRLIPSGGLFSIRFAGCRDFTWTLLFRPFRAVLGFMPLAQGFTLGTAAAQGISPERAARQCRPFGIKPTCSAPIPEGRSRFIGLGGLDSWMSRVAGLLPRALLPRCCPNWCSEEGFVRNAQKPASETCLRPVFAGFGVTGMSANQGP